MNNPIEVQPWFSNPVWKTFIDIDTESIIDYLYKLQQTDNGVIKSNNGGWQSNELPKPPVAHHDLVYKINNVLAALHVHMGIKNNLTTSIKHCWYNINHPYNYNSKHIHLDSVFSGVFYLQVPAGDCGDLVFYRENLVLSHLHHLSFESFNEMNSTIAKYSPQRLMLLVFPSWMEHEVLPNLTEQDRISFSFNATVG